MDNVFQIIGQVFVIAYICLMGLVLLAIGLGTADSDRHLNIKDDED
jgi:hypothetical protein